jgi:hypothetical protein
MALVKRAAERQAHEMTDEGARSTREERLATKLRENLRRRKAQARELPAERLRGGSGAAADMAQPADSGLSKGPDRV